MAETKTCKNCEHWVEIARGNIDLSDIHVGLMGDNRENRECDVVRGIITYKIEDCGFISNDFETFSFMVTEPDFGCTKFEPKGELK